MSGEIEKSVWQRFEHDPRVQAHAGLRASDRDRDVANDVLATAYAEGRIDPAELDERTDTVRSAKTLGALLPVMADLVADRTPPLVPRADGRSLREEAEAKYASKRNAAIWGFLTPTLICWAIWYFPAGGSYGFPWPLFVMLGTGLGALKTLTGRETQVREIQHDLEEKERRREEKRQRRLGPPAP